MSSPKAITALGPERSSWSQAGALFGSFLGAIGLGYAVGKLLQPEGDATTVYGVTLRSLAREGYLVPPDVE